MSEETRLIKLTMLVHRKAGMTEEEFYHHWTHVHTPIVQDWLKRHGIVRYVQNHAPSSLRTKAQDELHMDGPRARRMVDYDGAVELVMPDLQCYDNARNDPYYETHVKPDEESFFEASTAAIFISYEDQKF